MGEDKKLASKITHWAKTMQNLIDIELRQHLRQDGKPKTQYASQLLARNSHILKCIKRGNADTGAEPYKCRICCEWHNGHPRTSPRREKLFFDPMLEIELGMRVTRRIDRRMPHLYEHPYEANRIKAKKHRPSKRDRENYNNAEGEL